MKYVRTKDGRIVEEHNLESGFKQTIITIRNKKDNKVLNQIICDDMDEYIEMIVVGQYCKCHKINPKEIKCERIVLFNEILKQSDTIEELCDEFVLIHTEYDNSKDIFESYSGEAKHRSNPYYNFTFEQIRTGRRIIKGTIYGAIWTDKGLIYVAKMNDKGELELL